MSTDEKLRAILRAEADRVEPSPTGWNRITETIAVRRRRRLWVRGSLAAATAMSLVAVVALTAVVDRDDRGADGLGLTTQPPSPAPTGAWAPYPVDPIAVWPLTTQAEVEAWKQDRSTHPYLADLDMAADVFGREYLGIPKPVVRTPPPGEDANARYVFRAVEGTSRELAVTKVTFADAAPHTALSAKGGSLDVTSINGDTIHGTPIAIVSPLTVAGSFAGVDQPIDVVLRAAPSDGGGEIARARAEIGPDGWTATLTFATEATAGSLLATSYSNADGGLADAFAMPVSFPKPATEPSPTEAAPPSRPDGVYPEQFVAVDRGRIALYDTKTGARLRYLTDEQPGGGAMEPVVTDDGRSVVYLQGEGSCAASIRKVGIVARRTEVLVTSKDGRVPSAPAVAPDGTLAYAWSTCSNDGPFDRTSDTEVVVGTKHIPVQAEDHATVRDLAWDPDGVRLAVLANVCCDSGGEVWLIDPDEVSRVNDGDRIARETSCTFTSVTFTLDNRVLASEGCAGKDDGDPRSSHVRDLSDGNRAVVTVEGKEWIDSVDVDRTGDHLILGVLTCDETCDHAPSSAQRFSVDGEPLPAARDVAQPVWVG